MSESHSLEPATASSEHELRVILASHKIPTATVDELREKFSDIYVLVDLPVVFKPARGEQIERVFQKAEKERPRALRELASFLVVHPEPEAWLRLLERYPLAWSTVVEAAFAIASGKATTEAKKL